MLKLKVFHFINNNITEDIKDKKGKIITYRETAIIARTEQHARSIYKWSLPNDEYILVSETELNKDWQVPVGQYFNDRFLNISN